MSERFYKKEWLKDIDRIEQEENYDCLRLNRAERIPDFDSNFYENFVKTISQEDIKYYPDKNKLIESISNFYKINKNNILLCNGSVIAIKNFLEVFSEKDKEVIISDPCFPMHWIYSLTNNCKLVKIGYTEDFIFNIEGILTSINRDTTCICISNPISPMGNIIKLEEIKKILKKADKFDVPVLIDEAYIEFSDQKSCIDLISNHPNLIVSRTFSKALGAAGLRIGFLTGNTELLGIVKKISNPYEVSSVAIKFGIHLLKNYKIVEEYVESIKKERKIIEDILTKNRISYVRSETNTMHIEINKEGMDSYLKENKICCRIKDIKDKKYLCFSLYPGLSKSDFFNYFFMEKSVISKINIY